MPKKQVVVKYGWSEKAAELARLLLALEDAVEEYGIEDIYYAQRPGGYLVYPLPETSGVYEYVSRRAGVEVEKAGSREGLRSLREGYVEMLSIFREKFIPVLEPYARETGDRGVEYYAALLEDGEILLLEGYEGRVSLPFLRSWMNAHTHPPGHCAFSHKDVESMTDFYTHGGFVAGVVSGSCILAMYRRGFYTLRDHEALLSLAGRLRKAGSAEEYLEAYRDFTREAENLVLARIK